jgi:DNA polymerase III psi subunit
MGFEIYVPRALRDAAVARPASSPRARIVLIARTESASARSLLAQVTRALAFARVEASIAADAARVDDAAGLVVFGESLAREIGAAVPAERQKSIVWAGVGEPAEIVGNVAAKRALWSELRRLARAPAKTRAAGG